MKLIYLSIIVSTTNASSSARQLRRASLRVAPRARGGAVNSNCYTSNNSLGTPQRQPERLGLARAPVRLSRRCTPERHLLPTCVSCVYTEAYRVSQSTSGARSSVAAPPEALSRRRTRARIESGMSTTSRTESIWAAESGSERASRSTWSRSRGRALYLRQKVLDCRGP